MRIDPAMSVPCARTIYDCMDHHRDFSTNAEGMLNQEDELIAGADAVVVSSRRLEEAVGGKARSLTLIRNAGAVFMGQYSPVPLGDYAAGPSHVLPTGATARFASGLSSNDFLRAGSVTHFTYSGLAAIADDVIAVANKEGLTGHTRTVELRLKKS